jgi:hypothetical protein
MNVIYAIMLIVSGLFVLAHNIRRLLYREPPISGVPTVPADRPAEWYGYVPPDPEA